MLYVKVSIPEKHNLIICIFTLVYVSLCWSCYFISVRESDSQKWQIILHKQRFLWDCYDTMETMKTMLFKCMRETWRRKTKQRTAWCFVIEKNSDWEKWLSRITSCQEQDHLALDTGALPSSSLILFQDTAGRKKVLHNTWILYSSVKTYTHSAVCYRCCSMCFL